MSFTKRLTIANFLPGERVKVKLGERYARVTGGEAISTLIVGGKTRDHDGPGCNDVGTE